MWKEILCATALSTALAITPALAQDTQQGQTERTQDQTQGTTPQQGQAQYQGWPVFSSDGEKIGEVAEVMGGETDRERKLVVESEGFLGVGAKKMEVQGDQYQAAQNRIELRMTAEQAKELPEAS